MESKNNQNQMRVNQPDTVEDYQTLYISHVDHISYQHSHFNFTLLFRAIQLRNQEVKTVSTRINRKSNN